jgi:hypothetical protein
MKATQSKAKQSKVNLPRRLSHFHAQLQVPNPYFYAEVHASLWHTMTTETVTVTVTRSFMPIFALLCFAFIAFPSETLT